MPRRYCMLFGRACAAAVVLDVVIPRAGLVSWAWWRSDLGLDSFAVLSPVAYKVCLASCLAGAQGRPGRFTRYWLWGVRETASLGNPGMGSLFLLSLQAASLGYTLQHLGRDNLEHVMGATRYVLEDAGEQGAKDFYQALETISPSYLGRISYAGLPDATTSLWRSELKSSLHELLWEASLYDPVSRDAVNMMTYSLGYAYNTIKEEGLAEGVARANYCLAAWLGDLVAKRKTAIPPSLLDRACNGDPAAEAMLWSLARREGAGPASTADLVVNALARIVYEKLCYGMP